MHVLTDALHLGCCMCNAQFVNEVHLVFTTVWLRNVCMPLASLKVCLFVSFVGTKQFAICFSVSLFVESVPLRWPESIIFKNLSTWRRSADTKHELGFHFALNDSLQLQGNDATVFRLLWLLPESLHFMRMLIIVLCFIAFETPTNAFFGINFKVV